MCFDVELLGQVSRCNNNVNALSGPSNNKLDWWPLVGRILSYHAHYFEFKRQRALKVPGCVVAFWAMIGCTWTKTFCLAHKIPTQLKFIA